MSHPAYPLDYTIMLNAHEESRLAELLADYHQARPNLKLSLAQSTVAARLVQLIRSEKVGFYELPLDRKVASSAEYRDLTIEEAVALVEDSAAWGWEAPGENVFYCMFARDEQFWGDEAAG